MTSYELVFDFHILKKMWFQSLLTTDMTNKIISSGLFKFLPIAFCKSFYFNHDSFFSYITMDIGNYTNLPTLSLSLAYDVNSNKKE